MKIKYNGIINIYPEFTQEEFYLIEKFLSFDNNNDLLNFLNLPFSDLQIYNLLEGKKQIKQLLKLEKDKIIIDNIKSEIILKPCLEKFIFFFIEEKLLLKLKDCPNIILHKTQGLINGENFNEERWTYLIEDNKVYNLENEEKVLRPRFRPAIYENLLELAEIRYNIKCENRKSKIIKI